jgi:hypothetical protein
MPGQFPNASYPTGIWDGTSPTRNSVTEKRDPDKDDYDRLVAEIIATQNEATRVAGIAGAAATYPIIDPSVNIYEDLRFPVSSVNVSGTRPPLATEYRGGLVLAFEYKSLEAQEQVIFFNPQTPHGMRYSTGAYFRPHLHWTVVSPVAGKTVKFRLTMNFANINSSFAESPAYDQTVEITLAAADEHKHMMTLLPAISATAFTASAMGLCQLWRASSAEGATSFSGSIYLLEVDFHYLNERFGSPPP